MTPTISVALCTYNGALYLAEQLDSIAGQTLPPDELVVCDDASTDASVALATQFANQVPFPVRIMNNRDRVGYTPNFQRAAQAATGDIVFFSDQDDVWLPDKIDRMVRAMDVRTAILAIGNSEIVDANLRRTGRTIFAKERVDRGSLRRLLERNHPLTSLLRIELFSGHMMAVRSEVLNAALPVPDGWAYDQWFGTVGAAMGRVALVDDVLVFHRVHQANTSRAHARTKAVDILSRRLEVPWGPETRRFAAGVAALRNRPSLRGKAQAIELIDGKRRHCEARGAVVAGGRRGAVTLASELARLGYHHYSRGWRSAARDVLDWWARRATSKH